MDDLMAKTQNNTVNYKSLLTYFTENPFTQNYKNPQQSKQCYILKMLEHFKDRTCNAHNTIVNHVLSIVHSQVSATIRHVFKNN